MKKPIIMLLLFIINMNLPAQNGKVKLLFDIPGDIKNPSFFVNPNYRNPNSLLFEVNNGAVSNIYVSNYSDSIGGFELPVAITADNFRNINPAGLWTDSGKVIFFQTNKFGNWDIAYCLFNDNSRYNVKIIEDSASDDISPSIISFKRDFIPGNSPPGIVYQKNNSIYVFAITDSGIISKCLLQGSDSIKYSCPSAIYSSTYYNGNWDLSIKTIALQSDNSTNKKIIEDIHSLYGNYDSTLILDEGLVNNPHFISIYTYMATYEKEENQHVSVYSNDVMDINDSLNGNFNNLKSLESYRYLIIDKRSSFTFWPYIYSYQDSLNNYVGIHLHEKDTLILTKSINSLPAIDFLGYTRYGANNKEIYYSVWQDSINGNIKLFGLKALETGYSNVKNEEIELKNILYQNYPNPFNPSTTITYEIPKSGLVQLKVYDILGREVITLVNEVQSAGSHKVVFNLQSVGVSFSSGIYLYRLKTGSTIQSKKMLFLK